MQLNHFINHVCPCDHLSGVGETAFNIHLFYTVYLTVYNITPPDLIPSGYLCMRVCMRCVQLY